MKPLYTKLIDREKSLLGEVEIIHDVVYWPIHVSEQQETGLEEAHRQILRYIKAGYQDKATLIHRMRHLTDGSRHLDWLIENGWAIERLCSDGKVLLEICDGHSTTKQSTAKKTYRFFDHFSGSEFDPTRIRSLTVAEIDPKTKILEKPLGTDAYEVRYLECLIMLIHQGVRKTRMVRVYHEFDEMNSLQEVLYDFVLDDSDILKSTSLSSSTMRTNKAPSFTPETEDVRVSTQIVDESCKKPSTKLSVPVAASRGTIAKLRAENKKNQVDVPRPSVQPQPLVKVIAGRSAHEQILGEALNDARHHILIVTPFIRRRVVDYIFKQHMISALRRGVNINIIHGMPVHNDDYDDTHNENLRIERLVTELGHHRQKLKFVRVTATATPSVGEHSKILICDDRWAVVSSFNWLSFPETNETGVLIRDPQSVSQLLDTYNNYLDIAVTAKAENSIKSRIEVDVPVPLKAREMSEWIYGEYNSQ